MIGEYWRVCLLVGANATYLRPGMRLMRYEEASFNQAFDTSDLLASQVDRNHEMNGIKLTSHKQTP